MRKYLFFVFSLLFSLNVVAHASQSGHESGYEGDDDEDWFYISFFQNIKSSDVDLLDLSEWNSGEPKPE